MTILARTLTLLGTVRGVGKTMLTFNVAHMAAQLGVRTVLLDCDPQCDLTAFLIDEDDLADLWQPSTAPGHTVASCLEPVVHGSDPSAPVPRAVADDLWLVPGDLRLESLERPFAERWARLCGGDRGEPLRVLGSLAQLAEQAARSVDAELVLLDLGATSSALDRAGLLACDAFAVPMLPDLFSLHGLESLGVSLGEHAHDRALTGLDRAITPLGYVVQHHVSRLDRPLTIHHRWLARYPAAFHRYVLGDAGDSAAGLDDDPCCLAQLKTLPSLAPLAQLARRPIFELKQADGVGTDQLRTVGKARREFEALTRALLAGRDRGLDERAR
jgi:chromosome partitioning protein